jgi:hypothetical protein
MRLAMAVDHYENIDDYHLWVILTNPVPGEEAEFNRWYEEHVAEIVDVEGHTWGRRYLIDPDQRPGMHPHQHAYLALYGFVGEPNAVHAALAAADAAGAVGGSDALDPDYHAWVYTPVEDLCSHPGLDVDEER